MESYYEDFFQNKSVKPAPPKEQRSPSNSPPTEDADSKPQYQKPQAPRTTDAVNKIYISNMKPGTDEISLRQQFKQFGAITSVTHRGTYAFVEFVECEAAAAALKEMNGKDDMRVQKAYSKNTGTSYNTFDKDKYIKQYGNQEHGAGYYQTSPGSTTSAETYKKPAGAGQGDSCYKCHQPGHWANKCPNSQGGQYGGAGGAKPYGRGGGQYGGSGGGYQSGAGGQGDKKCFNCNKQGHWSRDCPEPRRPKPDDLQGGGGYKRFKNP